jgi:hypothetical protein
MKAERPRERREKTRRKRGRERERKGERNYDRSRKADESNRRRTELWAKFSEGILISLLS